MALQKGDTAPSFTLYDTEKNKVSLEKEEGFLDNKKPIFMLKNEIEQTEAHIEELNEVNEATQQEYDNSKSSKSIFTENQDSLQSFIYTNIDWDKIPDLKDEKVKVFVSIQSGETTKPDSIMIIRGVENKLYNQEALRVVKLIPEWAVYYRLGEVYSMKWTLPIIFDEQKRRKYARTFKR
ncbi:MAG: hypothetical protein IH948_05565 [Bacteroidetes bacterium]|nr:hypothetical protein [Bacteroidota bacterium]